MLENQRVTQSSASDSRTRGEDAVTTDDQASPVYTLHYFPFSMYSLISRFGFVLGQKLNPETAPKVKFKLVNLHRDEHLFETYLTSINAKGQVPALTSSALPSSLDDSRDIAKWLCRIQPELLPPEHEDTIRRLMGKFNSFHAMPLILSPETRQYGIPNEAAARLEDEDISHGYRRALEIKSMFHESTQGQLLDPENMDEVEEQAQDFVQDLTEVLRAHQGGKPWVFGSRPTILDAQATVLLARLLDVKRYDLLSDETREYAQRVTETSEWRMVTHGRPTVWDVSMGHAADLNPL